MVGVAVTVGVGVAVAVCVAVGVNVGSSQNLRSRLSRSWFAKLRSDAGMHPLNELPDRKRVFKTGREPSAVGILPVNRLLKRLRVLSLVRALRLGIDPVNWLLLRSSAVRLLSARRFEIDPLIPLLERRSAVTRPLLSAVTPYQLPSVSSLSQLLFRVQLAPPVAL